MKTNIETEAKYLYNYAEFLKDSTLQAAITEINLGRLKKMYSIAFETVKRDTDTGDFECQLGAFLDIETITTIEVDGIEYINKEKAFESHWIGKMSDEEANNMQEEYLYSLD